jgi:DNA polymerase elongation subunit (family B)
MTGEGLDDKDLAISKLLRQDMQKYRSLFPHVSATIQSRKYPLRGDTIQYIYTDSKHSNPICRVTPIENLKSMTPYDKKKYKETILEAAGSIRPAAMRCKSLNRLNLGKVQNKSVVLTTFGDLY